MKKIFFVLFFIAFTGPLINADPAWLKPNMKKSDCDNVFWKHAPSCYIEYNMQQIGRLKQYVRDQIEYGNFENCNKDILLTEFDDRESAWNEYSARYCAFLMHCSGSCGSGYTSSYASCTASKLRERLDFLENEIKDGVEIYGCAIKNAKSDRVLSTENYDIVLTGNCELGLFSCDDVIYRGINRKNSSEITLSGKALMKPSEEYYFDTQVGFVFENGDIEYQVMNSGLLKVIDNKQDKILLAEEGRWK